MSLALQPALADDLFGNHPLTPEARDAFVTELLKKMTVDEKIGQLRLISVGPDNPKEAIREMIKDGQVGAIFNTVTRQDIRAMQDQVMELSRLKIPLFFAYDVLHGQRTVFPISLGLASSFNLDAVKTVGRVSAYEAADDGLNMTWAPMVDVSRDPRWGRASEGFGEDTYLTSIMGKTMVEAMQGKSPADRYSVMTSVKHFAAYGAVEGGKEYNTVDMSPQRLFNEAQRTLGQLMRASPLPVRQILPDAFPVECVLPHQHFAKEGIDHKGAHHFRRRERISAGALFCRDGQHRHFGHALRPRMRMPRGVRDPTRRVLKNGDVYRFNFHYRSLSPAISPEAENDKGVL